MSKTTTTTKSKPLATDEPMPAAPKGRLPEARPAEEFGLTDGLDAWVERFEERLGFEGLHRLLEHVDRRATVRVTGEAVEVRGLLRHRSVSLDHVRAVEVRTPLAVLGNVVPFWEKLLWVVPAGRLGKVVKLAGTVAPRLRHDPEEVAVDELDRPVVAALRRVGPKLTLRGAPALVALVHPRLTERVLEEARRRGIHVDARR